MKNIIVIAGGTGHLGQKIIHCLLKKNVSIHAIVRFNTNAEKIARLQDLGVRVIQVDMTNTQEVCNACKGASCVVSALSGLRDVIIVTQRILLDAAILAAVPRFIPSDFCLDFRNLIPGENRNLDLRREFHKYLDQKPIAATTIFNGAFMDLLIGPMPLILFKIRRVLYWGNVDQLMDFTAMDDVAAFTANVALEKDTPRFLQIAGDRITTREINAAVSEIMPRPYKLIKAGSIGLLNRVISLTKFISPGKNDLYPAWQGMQYMRDMMEGRAKLGATDNHRYQSLAWTSIKQFLSSNIKKALR